MLKREYVYQRTVSVKGIDGTETFKTMKLRTPHDETHLMCANPCPFRTCPAHKHRYLWEDARSKPQEDREEKGNRVACSVDPRR